jgi:predicted GIY-YIG superfamily endonuclease
MKRKRAQLVCQHLENVSRSVLEEYQDIVRQYVRGRHGVYALYRKGKLYYVGLARNLRNRLKHHLKDRHGKSWDRFSVYLTIGDHHLRELESLILRIVKPVGNKQKGKFAKCEDMRRRFRRDIKRTLLAEIETLFRDRLLPSDDDKPRKAADGRRPALATYVARPFNLRAVYKGKMARARVRRDGRIRFAGKLYSSPSIAGAKACSRPSCNGWTFWQFERAPGDWVPLDELRR